MTERRPVVELLDPAMVDVLRKKTDQERLRIAGGMWQSARFILRGAIRTEHPEWDQAAIDQEIARRISHGAVNHETC